MKLTQGLLTLMTACIFAATLPAHATTIFSLTNNACSVGCNVLPAGTITLMQNGVNDVRVTATLTNDYTFRVAPDRNHHALVFDLTGVTGVTATNISNSFFVFKGFGSYKDAGLGANFAYAFEDQDPNRHPANVMSFSFDLKGTGLMESSFSSNGSNYFGVDVKGLDAAAGIGQTGNIGAPGPGTTIVPVNPVPEPSTFALMGTGLLGFAGMVRGKFTRR